MTSRRNANHRRVPISGRLSRGVTLIEILVVVGIIGILVAVIGLVGHTVKEKGKRELTRSIMDTLMSAIEEFHTATGQWPLPANDPNRTAWNNPTPQTANDVPYEPGEPLNLGHNNTRAYDDYYLGLPATFFQVPPETSPGYIGDHTITSIEGLLLCLDAPWQGPFSASRLDTDTRARIRAILAKLPPDAKAKRHPEIVQRYRSSVNPNISAEFVDAMQVLDAWGTPLRYRYYTYRNNGRPFLWSAGPDKKFAADPNRTENDPNGKDDIFSDRKD